MKKCITVFALVSLISMSLFGCSKKEGSSGNRINQDITSSSVSESDISLDTLQDISDVKQTIKNELIYAKNAEYSNLEFSDFTISFPDIDSYYNLSLYTDRNSVSIEETYNSFCNQVMLVAPDIEFDEKNIYFCPKDLDDSYNCYANGYPRVIEYKNDLFSKKIETWWYMYETDTEGISEDNLYLWLDPYTLFGVMIKGNGKNVTEPAFEHLNFWESNMYENVEAYYPVERITDEEQVLADGKSLSLSSAVTIVNDFFSRNKPKQLNSNIKTEVVGIEVRKHNDTIGLKALLANKYNDIPFDYEHNVSFKTNSDDRVTQSANAFIAISDEVDYFYNLQIWTNIDTKGNEVKAIIPLQQALKITSELLTDNIKFKVNDIKFVYLMKGDPTKTVEATGAWKITTYNPNDSRTYQVYVNAETGDAKYYSIR